MSLIYFFVKSIKVSKNGIDWADVVEITDVQKAQIGDINVTE